MAQSRLAAQEPCVLAPRFEGAQKKLFRTVSEKQEKRERERDKKEEESGGERECKCEGERWGAEGAADKNKLSSMWRFDLSCSKIPLLDNICEILQVTQQQVSVAGAKWEKKK